MVPRVFIVWTNRLFYESVRVLLEHPNVQVVGASHEHAAARAEIEALRPDTILIEESEDPTRNGEALLLLETSAWNPWILRMSMHDNELRAYHREQRTIEHADDLLKMIWRG